MARCAIYGAGSLGTVLGAYITKNGGDIVLVNRNQAHVQVLNEKGAVVSEKVVGNDVVEFTNLAPGKYTIRAIADDNANGKWDAGNYWKSIQSEKVYYMPKTLELRSNWDIEETFELVE